jgi:hypothetical protein
MTMRIIIQVDSCADSAARGPITETAQTYTKGEKSTIVNKYEEDLKKIIIPI